ncbi:MAG: cytochrome b [Rubrivivax sp.]|nr:cytochrome b [Rubrivivax sp.]
MTAAKSAEDGSARYARYTPTAVVLHWLIALQLAASFALGLYMTELPTGVHKLKLYNWHKWAGAMVFAVCLLRLAWRATHAPPPPPPMPRWQVRAAAAVHAAMYLLFFLVPLLGWAYSSALGFPLVWFGVLSLPDWVPQDRELASALKPWHARAAWLLAALVVVHVAATIKHQWVDSDMLLRRMAPWLR